MGLKRFRQVIEAILRCSPPVAARIHLRLSLRNLIVQNLVERSRLCFIQAAANHSKKW